MAGVPDASELEVDEGDDVGALELQDNDDGDREVEGLHQRRGLGDPPADGRVDHSGHEVDRVAAEDQQKDFGVSDNELAEDFRVEGGEDLADHVPTRGHRVGPEKDPTEAYDVEGDEDAADAPKWRHRVARGAEAGEMVHHELMNGQRCPVKSAPEDEAARCAVPESAEEHRKHEVDVRTDAAAPIAAETDI